MECPACATGNPDGAKFCLNCGTKLANACPSCATELPPGAKFCFQCGHQLSAAPPAPAPEPPAAPSQDLQRYIPEALLKKLSAARASGGMQGERRVVTMLFCDVKGSTAAAEHLDPEEWADIMNGAFQRLIAPVYRYEGTLARLMGDAILAFFGAPIAHEDDPERAVLAALDILEEIRPYIARVQAEWGIEIDVRVGINTGLVVVGDVGSDLRLEYTAMGDAVNLAARMEQTAEPGTVQISEDTHRRVQNLFSFEEIGAIEVKGKREPVRAWRVLGSHERPASERGIAGLDAPMIGRDGDLERLNRAMDQVRRGHGCVVSIIGEAGLGKSRLVAEWKKVHAATCRDEVTWHEGRSLSYEGTRPYTPFKAIFRDMLGVTTDGEQAHGQVLTAVRAHFSDDPALRAAVLCSLLGVPLTGDAMHRVRYLEPPVLRAKVFEGVLQMVEAVATVRPTILVLEDLHWADASSLELANALQEVTERAMLLVVALFRPRHDDGSWQFHAHAEQVHPHRYLPVRLAPLPDDDARTLVGSLLRIDGLPVPVRELILERAEGNPFFVEEVIRTLLDDGLVVREGDTWRATAEIRTIQVPDTLNGVLTSRLDKLDDGHRRAAQIAAVIGREFDHQTLAAVAPDPMVLHTALPELQRRGIVREISRIPARRYRFKHGLTRDAAYQTLLHKHRRQIHTAVASCWEAMDVDRPGEIANHLVAGRQVARALPYLVQAGEQAAAAHAVPEALAWFDKAIAYVRPETDIDIAKRAWEGVFNARKLDFDVPGALAATEALVDLGRAHEHPPAVVSGLNKQAYITGFFLGDTGTGEPILRQAEAIATESQDDLGLIECEMYMCAFRTAVGDFEEVERYMRQLMGRGKALGAEEPHLYGMAHLSSSLMYMTRYDDALAQAKRTLALAERVGNRFWASEMLCWAIPMCHIRNGAIDEALDVARRGTEMALAIGAHGEAAMGYCTRAQIALMRGHFEEAIDLNTRFVESADTAGLPYLKPLAQCCLGSTYIEIAGSELGGRAEPFHRKALELMEAPGGAGFGTWLCTEVGYCTIAHGAWDMADKLFDDALTVPNGSMFILKPRALLGKARVALQRGDLTAALAHQAACDTYTRERGMKHTYAEVHEVGARIHDAAADAQAALESTRKCEEAARAMGMRTTLYRVLARRSRLLAQLGDPEAPAAETEARSIIDAIAREIEADDIRAAFLTHASSQLEVAVTG